MLQNHFLTLIFKINEKKLEKLDTILFMICNELKTSLSHKIDILIFNNYNKILAKHYFFHQKVNEYKKYVYLNLQFILFFIFF